jgi:hypothetical protein
VSIYVLESNLEISDVLKTLNGDLCTIILVLVELYRLHDALYKKISQSHDSCWEKQIGKYLSDN